MRSRSSKVLILLLILGCDDEPAASADAATDPDGPLTDAAADAAPPDGSAPDAGPPPITWPALGPLAAPAGRGSFRFGAATAGAQIEDGLVANDWYYFTLPEAEGGLGRGTFVGGAVQGYTRALEDVGLLAAMGLDAYRFAPEWSRIEPTRDLVDEEALAHYGAVLDALEAAGIRPMITVHHFSSPRWAHDLLAEDCPDDADPTDDNLCGWGHPRGGPLLVEELAEHAALLARRYGDRVDDWCTLNEPINYLLASYGVGMFPPGRRYLLGNEFPRLVNAYRTYLAAHVAMYRAIKENDTFDADGDGINAEVGLTLSVAKWEASQRNMPSEAPADVAARERVEYIYHYAYVDSLRSGTFDPDLDGVGDEPHPEWQGALDWLGVQYYFRAGVTGTPGLIRELGLTPCFGEFDFGSCLPVEEETWWVPDMRYEFYAPGIHDILVAMSARWPDLPLTVTEAGIATRVGARRAENVVRVLEQIQRARDAGADVRGYYHWSLMDNFEWAEGYEPRFGLYTVDLATYERTATEGATVLGAITEGRVLTGEQRARFGGDGPMTPEPEH